MPTRIENITAGEYDAARRIYMGSHSLESFIRSPRRFQLEAKGLVKATDSSAKLAASRDFVEGLNAQASDLTHDLFAIRANWLQGKTEDASREYLSGLLIGAEIKSAKSWCQASQATIVASDSLAEIYIFALAHFGIKATVEGHENLIKYFVALAKKVENKA